MPLPSNSKKSASSPPDRSAPATASASAPARPPSPSSARSAHVSAIKNSKPSASPPASSPNRSHAMPAFPSPPSNKSTPSTSPSTAADEVDPYLNLTKGGGGNLTREKVIASITKKFVIVVGEEKIVPRLGTNFPVFVEVIEFARPVVTRKLQSMGAAQSRPVPTPTAPPSSQTTETPTSTASSATAPTTTATTPTRSTSTCTKSPASSRPASSSTWARSDRRPCRRLRRTQILIGALYPHRPTVRRPLIRYSN